MQDPADTNGYLSDNQGVVWVTFDKSTGTAGNTTQTIYVGVADLQNTVYRTTNGGTTWERVAGQPTGYLAHQGVDRRRLPLHHHQRQGRPVRRRPRRRVEVRRSSTGAWTQISPVPSTDTPTTTSATRA